MTDRELLELAAKAAGYEWEYEDTGVLFVFVPQAHEWNPLTDDGDALRLAVKCNMHLVGEFPVPDLALLYACKGDPYAATRRAIVRVAAEIGKELV
jgi:hypothetical protein